MTTLYKETALPALQRIAAVTEKKNTIPILANVLIRVSGNTATFIGTDLDIEMTVTVPCNSDIEWETTVNAQDLAKAFARAKDAINLSFDDGMLTVSFGKTRIKFATLETDTFPQVANADYDVTFEMPAVTLVDQMNRAIVAASTEETRYYLNGVYWHSVDGVLTAVATDGHKLALVSSDVGQDMPGIIVPTKTANLLKEIEADTVIVSASNVKVRLEFGDTVIVSKVIDGTFPDYNRVIPTDNPNRLTVSGKELKDAIATVSIITEGKTRAIQFDVIDGAVTVSAKGAIGDEAVVELPCEAEGDVSMFTLNGPYVVAVASQVHDGDVVFEIAGSMDPVRVTSTGGDMFSGVIMPMRG